MIKIINNCSYLFGWMHVSVSDKPPEHSTSIGAHRPGEDSNPDEKVIKLFVTFDSTLARIS